MFVTRTAAKLLQLGARQGKATNSVLRRTATEITQAAATHTNGAVTTSSENALMTTLVDISTELKDLRAALVDENNKNSKISSLQFALLHADIGQFKYCATVEDLTYHRQTFSSKDILPEIVMSFMREQGRYIEGYVEGDSPWEMTPADIARARIGFETALCDQIHGLTGTRPRIESYTSHSDGQPTAERAIYYE